MDRRLIGSAADRVGAARADAGGAGPSKGRAGGLGSGTPVRLRYEKGHEKPMLQAAFMSRLKKLLAAGVHKEPVHKMESVFLLAARCVRGW